MRLAKLLPVAFLASSVSAAKSWAGTNSYFLQGMFEGKDQIEHIQGLAANCVKVVRLWVRHQIRGCEKGTRLTWPVPPFEETLGVYNDQTLDLLDQTLSLIREHSNGMKVIISPHDGNNVYGIAKPDDPYTKYGHEFYTNDEAASFFDGRIRHILDYKGKYTGQVWKNFSDLIIAFDLQNEPFVGLDGACGATLESDAGAAAVDWVCKRARFIRNGLLGADNRIKIVSGGLGGSAANGCSFLLRTMQCPELDGIAVHVYPGVDSVTLEDDINNWKSHAQDKYLFVEELGFEWRGKEVDIAAAFKKATDKLNAAGIPWLSWSIIPDPGRGCEKNYNEDGDVSPIPITREDVDFKSAMNSAANAESHQDWGF